MKYSFPGRTCLTELIIELTCLMLSKMVPSFTKIILLCLPINSMIKCLVFMSPNSSKCCISKSTIRSSPGWVIEIIRPLFICFLRSIQKLGAVRGAGLFLSVRYIKGRLALALISKRYWFLPFLIVSNNSSLSVCAILYNLPLSNLSLNSATKAEMVIPSNAI